MSDKTTVEGIITDARTFASDSYSQADALISNAQSYAQGFTVFSPRTLYFSPTPSNPVDIDADDPGVFNDGFQPPTSRPSKPSYSTFYKPSLPQFDQAPEALDTSELFQFDRPVYDIAAFDKSAPDLDTDFEVPDMPELVEYDDPQTSDLSLRETPQVEAPRFDHSVQIVDPGDAPEMVAQYQAELTSSLPVFRDWVETHTDAWLTKMAPEYYTAMAQLESKIAEGYQGNTAMPDSVEQQLFDRAVSRSEDEKSRLNREAADAFGKRGYRVPPVTLFNVMAANNQVVAKNASDAAREVAIERARLEHQHVQFVMQISTTIRDGLRNQVVQYAQMLLSLNGQAIGHAKQIADLMAGAYRMKLDHANFALDHLRTLATIFETEMKSAMADIEIFRLEMEAAKTRKDAELVDVSVWEKKIDAQNTRINRYLARLKAVAEKANIEKLKILQFGEEVKAYAAHVNAKEAEYGVYRAAIDGDQNLVAAHAATVSAYAAKVQATRTAQDGEIAHSNAVSNYNKNLTEVYRAELGAYETDVRAEGTRVGTNAEVHKVALTRYRERLDAQLAALRLQYEEDRLILAAEKAKVDADVKTAVAQSELHNERIKLRANTAMAGAESFGVMASSAVSAQNTMVNLVNETIN